MLADPELDPDMRDIAAAELAGAERRTEAMSSDSARAAAEGRRRRGQRNPRGPGGHRRRRGGAVRRRFVPHVCQIRGAQRWKVDVLSTSEGTAGGFKEIIAEIVRPRRLRAAQIRERRPSGAARAGDGDAGPHPHLGRNRRRHADRAGVDFEINEADLKIDTMRSGGAGGQHVNKTESAIRITHLPTGIVVAMQEERSQHRNRAKAMALLRSRILDAQEPAARRRTGQRAALAGRFRRPVAAHPHL